MDSRMRTVALAAFASVLGVTSVLAPREVAAEPGKTFVATLVGDQETPPNTSGALAKGSAGLNPDDTFSYSIKSTRFDTDFRVAHLHLGGPGVAGPIAFPLECNSQGTACANLTAAHRGREGVAPGRQHLLQHAHRRVPGGEIRGQVLM